MRKFSILLVVWTLTWVSVIGNVSARPDEGLRISPLTAAIESNDQTAHATFTHPFQILDGSVSPLRPTGYYLSSLLGPVDAGVSAILRPQAVQCFSSSDSIVLAVTNFGTDTLDFAVDNMSLTANVSGSNTGTYTTTINSGTLAPAAVAVYTLTTAANFSSSGFTTLTAFTTIGQDTVPSNDTTAFSFTVNNSVGTGITRVSFTGFDGNNLNLLFPQWYEASGAVSPGPPGISSWGDKDFINQPTPNGTAANVNLFSNFLGGEWMVGPIVSATASTQLTFDIAVTTWNQTTSSPMGSDDSVNVYISTDCGGSFQLLESYTAIDNIGNTLQPQVISLAAFAGQDVIVAFYANDGAVNDPEDYDFFIDNINIKQALPVDFEVQALVSPIEVGCLDSTEDVTVRLLNAGTTALNLAIDSVRVFVDITGPVNQSYTASLNSGTLAQNATVDVALTTNANFGVAGVYNVLAYSVSTADGVSSNDTLLIQRINVPSGGSTLPLQNFSLYTGANLSAAYPGWIEFEGQGQPLTPNPFSSWTSRNFINSAANPNGTSIYLNLYSNFFEEWFLSPKFTATSQTQVSFDLALTVFNGSAQGSLGSDDTLGVYVSTDCGLSFQPVRLYTSASTISATGQNEVVDLSTYAGQDVILGFYATAGANADPQDNDVYIDNINIRQLLPIDAQTNAFVTPAAIGCLTDMEEVSLQIENVGISPINFSIDTLKLRVDISGPINQSYSLDFSNGTLGVGNSVDLVLTTAADFSIPGSYDLVGYLSIATDLVTANDTVSIVIVNDSSVGAAFDPVDFDTYNGGNLNSLFPGWFEWEGVGRPNSKDPASPWLRADFANNPASPFGDAARLNIWSTNVFGWIIGPKFTPDSNSILVYDLALTPFSGTASTSLGSDDTAAVYISTDCGETYVLEKLYDSNSTISNTGEKDTIDLNPYAGQDIIVAFYGNSGTTNDPEDNDFFIDNINVVSLEAGDKAIGRFVSPPNIDLGCSGPDQTVIVSVQNSGSGILDFANDSLSLTVEITGPTALTESYSVIVDSGTLASLGTIEIFVTDTADFSLVGTYDLLAYISSTGDTILVNDTLRASRMVVGPAGTSLPVVDFTGFAGNNLPAISGGWSEWTGVGRPAVEDQGSSWVQDDYNNVGGGPNGTSAKINLWLLGKSDWMISPKFSATINSLLFYDIAIAPFGASGAAGRLGSDDTLGVYISTDCGLNWSPVRLYTDSLNLPAGGRTDTVDLSPYAGQDILVAFYGTEGTTDDPEDNDVFIDNINIREFFDNDAASTELILPPNLSCGDSLATGQLVITNQGFLDLSSVPYEVRLDGPSGSQVFSGTLTASPALSIGQSDTVGFGPFNTSGGGNFLFTATTQYGIDQNVGNDTVKADIELGSTQPIVVEAVDPVCVRGTAVLRVVDPRSTGVDYEWSIISGIDTLFAGRGDSLITQSIIQPTTTYLVNEVSDTLDAGAPDNTLGSGGNFTSEAGLIFDAFVGFTLEQVTVYPSQTGPIDIILRDGNGALVYSQNVNLSVTSGPQQISLGWQISAGSDYSISTPPPTGGMFRNNSGAVYPYTLPGVLSIKETLNSLGSSGFYYFYYDWKVTVGLCDRPEGVVNIQILDSTSSSFTATALDDKQVDIQDLSTSSDSVKYFFGDGDSSSLATGIHTYPAPGTYTVTQIAYGNCGNDTTTQKVDVICTLPVPGFTWVLDPSDPDGLTIAFTSTATRDDSLSYELLPSVFSDVPSFGFAFPGSGEYVVSMTVFNVCGDSTFTDTISVIQTGLENMLDLQSLNIYPNPSKGQFQLEMRLLQMADINIEVVDMRGKVLQRNQSLREKGEFAQRFDLGRVPDGIYLLKIMVNDEMLIRKIQLE